MKSKQPTRARQEKGAGQGKEKGGGMGNKEMIMKYWRLSAGFLFGVWLLLVILEGIFKDVVFMKLSVSFLIVALIFAFSYGITDLTQKIIKKMKSKKK